MKFYNQSKHYVRVNFHSAFPPNQENTVARMGDQGPGTEASCDLKPGDYYMYINTTNIGPIPPGITIAASGGVPAEGTVTLTGSDRISVA